MRIAIPCEGGDLNSSVSMHFGRASHFMIADVVGNKVEKVEFIRNPFESHAPGQIPRFLHSLGVNVVIAYGMGIKARMFFESLGIDVVTGAYGRVGDVLNGFLSGNLELDMDWESREGFHRHGHGEGCRG